MRDRGARKRYRGGFVCSSWLAAAVLILASPVSGQGEAPVELPVDPMVLDQPMKDWLAEEVPPAFDDFATLSRLLNALHNHRDGSQLRYQEGYTGTAAEAFHSGEVNCLSFSHLLIGMARELDVEAFYMDVRQIEHYTKEGDLVIIAGHVTAGFDQGNERKVLEFSVGPRVDYEDAVAISDVRARAYHHSNRGAELMRTGELEEAVPWLETAITIDPELPDAWVNLGVVRRRTGDAASAERHYRRALEIDSEFFPAYQNLAALFRMRGDPAAAEQLLELMDRHGSRNPFVYLALGDLSMERSEYDDARSFYRQGYRRQRSEPELSAALGQAELALGDRAAAEKWLQKARKKASKKDVASGRVERLEAALAAPDTQG